ncbi:concanavalin A-like lectin/glucanase domain-containing protein [Cladochytrium replicatum]|nr:concanavalin A-like lectin/glucanase domain-containing protein [Cladochytrium replicatum]
MHTTDTETNDEITNSAESRSVRSGHSKLSSELGKSSSAPGLTTVPATLDRLHLKEARNDAADYEWRQKRMKDPTLRFLKIVPWLGIIPSLIVGGVIVWLGIRGIPNNKYCLVLDEQFDTFDTKTWSHEFSLGGFGNGEFQYTTDDQENVFVRDGKLNIVPTLTEDKFGREAIFNGYTLNLTEKGCKSDKPWLDCWRVSNSTNFTVLPPVASGRITTKNSVSIKYGKVEISVKMPRGDWMWPAVWMFPRDSVYGDWPASGEIDIAESRGNPFSYTEGGYNQISSTLQWGLIPDWNRYLDTQKKLTLRHGSYNDGFHKFGMEWTPNYLTTWVDSPLRTNLYQAFDKPFFQKGSFPLAYPNGSASRNPNWKTDGSSPSPFDQEFFLVLNVAVGNTKGYFPDGDSKKPWVNTSPNAQYDFIKNKDAWYPSWPDKNSDDRGMVVDFVKIWQLCN